VTVVKWEDTDLSVGVEIEKPNLDKHRKPLAAAGLSVLWPGFGHAYLGRTAPAVGLVAAMVLLVVLTVLPEAWRVTVPAWGVLVVVAAVTAWRTAAKDRDRT
jgi:carbon starvation protein CstA